MDIAVAEFEARPTNWEGRRVLGANILVRKEGLGVEEVITAQAKCVKCALAGPCRTLDNGEYDETWLGAYIQPERPFDTEEWTVWLNISNCKPVMVGWEV